MRGREPNVQDGRRTAFGLVVWVKITEPSWFESSLDRFDPGRGSTCSLRMFQRVESTFRVTVHPVQSENLHGFRVMIGPIRSIDLLMLDEQEPDGNGLRSR